MNRKKALYQYEFGNMKWFLCGGVGCVIVAVLLLNTIYTSEISLMNEIPIFLGTASFMKNVLLFMERFTVMAILAIALMTAYQFSDYHKRNQREYIISLPYTQRERFAAKTLVGAGILTAACLILGIGICILRVLYYKEYAKRYLISPEYEMHLANDTWYHLIRTLLLFWIIALVVYAVFVLIHSVVSGEILASIMGIGIIAAPAYLVFMLFFGSNVYDLQHMEKMREMMAHLTRSILGGSYYYEMGVMDESVNVDFAFSSYVDYGPVNLVLLVLVLTFVACVVLAYIVNMKQDGAKMGCVIPSKVARGIISAGIAVCFSFPIAELFVWCFDVAKIVCCVIQILIIIVLYIINQKVFKRVVK